MDRTTEQSGRRRRAHDNLDRRFTRNHNAQRSQNPQRLHLQVRCHFDSVRHRHKTNHLVSAVSGEAGECVFELSDDFHAALSLSVCCHVIGAISRPAVVDTRLQSDHASARSHASVQVQVGRSGRSAARPLHLSGATGGRHPPLQGHSRSRRRRSAATLGDVSRHCCQVQQLVQVELFSAAQTYRE